MLFLYQVVFTVGGSNLPPTAQTTLAQVLEFAARTLALTQLAVLLPEVTRVLSTLPLPPPTAFPASPGKLVDGIFGTSRAAGDSDLQLKAAGRALEAGASATQLQSVDVVDGALPSKMDAVTGPISSSIEDEGRKSQASDRADNANAEERVTEEMEKDSAGCEMEVDVAASLKRFPVDQLVSFRLTLPALDVFAADASAGLFMQSFTRLLQLLHAALSLVAVMPVDATRFSRFARLQSH